MSIRVVRLGTDRAKGEGLRLGTVRRPPRGVKKERLAADNWYDVWLPQLSPSADLVKQAEAKAKAAHKTVEFVVYPDAPHGFHADYRPSYRPD